MSRHKFNCRLSTEEIMSALHWGGWTSTGSLTVPWNFPNALHGKADSHGSADAAMEVTWVKRSRGVSLWEGVKFFRIRRYREDIWESVWCLTKNVFSFIFSIFGVSYTSLAKSTSTSRGRYPRYHVRNNNVLRGTAASDWSVDVTRLLTSNAETTF